MKSSIIILLGLIILNACKKDDNESNTSEKTITIENYSTIAEDGQTIIADTADWKLSTNIPTEVLSLFGDDAINYCDTSLMENNLIAYPNPVNDVLNLSHPLKAGANISYKIVDEQLNIEFELDSITDFTRSYSIPDLKGSGKLLRLYYKVNKGNCVQFGFGDLKFN